MAAVTRVILDKIPVSEPVPSDFRLVGEATGSELEQGQVTVMTRMLGLNAGLRARLGTGSSTTLGPAIDIGDTPQSDGIGLVVQSRHPGLDEGDSVVGLLPWATSSNVDGARLRRLEPGADALRQLTILGHVGLTAYAGLVTVGRLQRGETVWISAAAGGVGCCAVQIADRLGAEVIASAAGAERLNFLQRELKVRHVLERTRELGPQLREAAPEGLDLYFDSVGGEHLASALDAMRDRGRIVLVGRAGRDLRRPVLDDTSLLIRKRIQMIGFSVTDHEDVRPELEALVLRTDVDQPMVGVASLRNGIESIPEAFCDLLAGKVLGRVVVELPVARARETQSSQVTSSL